MIWKWAMNMRKAHCFVAGRSLCGRWGDFGLQALINQKTEDEPGPDDCKACFRIAKRRKDKAAEEAAIEAAHPIQHGPERGERTDIDGNVTHADEVKGTIR